MSPLFCIVHHNRVSAHAAYSGLQTTPASRLRKAIQIIRQYPGHSVRLNSASSSLFCYLSSIIFTAFTFGLIKAIQDTHGFGAGAGLSPDADDS